MVFRFIFVFGGRDASEDDFNQIICYYYKTVGHNGVSHVS